MALAQVATGQGWRWGCAVSTRTSSHSPRRTVRAKRAVARRYGRVHLQCVREASSFGAGALDQLITQGFDVGGDGFGNVARSAKVVSR